jgi:hypothetical protein
VEVMVLMKTIRISKNAHAKLIKRQLQASHFLLRHMTQSETIECLCDFSLLKTKAKDREVSA